MLGSQETPNHATRSASVGLCLEYLLYIRKRAPGFSDSPQSSRLRLSPFLSGIPSSMGLDFVARWLCMALTGFTPRECSPLPVPNAPVGLMVGGASGLGSALPPLS